MTKTIPFNTSEGDGGGGFGKTTETVQTELEEQLSQAADSVRAHLWHLEIDSGQVR